MRKRQVRLLRQGLCKAETPTKAFGGAQDPQKVSRADDFSSSIKKNMKVLIWLLVTFPLLANNYTTSFPATENPISESGKWSNGGQSPALDWTNCQTTTGLAFGTESISSGTDDDSTCILNGTWGPNQT